MGSGDNDGGSKIRSINTCPKRESQARQNWDGVTGVGSQRYKCMQCGSKYMPVQKARGYDQETRKKAIQLYVDGINLRRIGRHLGLHHRTISLWVQAVVDQGPAVNMYHSDTFPI